MLPKPTMRLIACLAPSTVPFESRHCWWGGPGTRRVPMPRPDVLLLEGDEFGHAMLYCYTAAGEFAGDTWHESVELAQQAAAHEYGAAVGPWQPVPEGEGNAHDFAVRQGQRLRGES